MININQQNTTDDLQKHHALKEAYVILPGHPFYGLKVTILQQGKTDSQAWCLIRHPLQKEFHYRISSQWLAEQPPVEKRSLPYNKNEIAFPFSQLQKLALFIHCKLYPVISSLDNKVSVGYRQQNNTEASCNAKDYKKRSSKDLVQSTTAAKDENHLKAIMDSDIYAEKETS